MLLVILFILNLSTQKMSSIQIKKTALKIQVVFKNNCQNIFVVLRNFSQRYSAFYRNNFKQLRTCNRKMQVFIVKYSAEVVYTSKEIFFFSSHFGYYFVRQNSHLDKVLLQIKMFSLIYHRYCSFILYGLQRGIGRITTLYAGPACNLQTRYWFQTISRS